MTALSCRYFLTLMKYFFFRMALNKRTLNITCDLNSYFFCRMPDNTLEVEVKIKTKWGKYTLHQDNNTCTEKYCSWDRASRRANVHTRQRKTPPREIMSSSHHTNTISETDIPMGDGFEYPLKSLLTQTLQPQYPLLKMK